MSEDEKKKKGEEAEAEAEKSEIEGKAESEGEAVESRAEATDDGTEDEGDEEGEEDSASPEAVAKRLEAMGGEAEDESELLAREEEAKLAARRAKARKGGGKKSGLETAASRKLAKIGTKAKPRKRAMPDAVEAADPLIERTQRLGDWVKRNVRVVQGAVVAVLVGGVGLGIYAYMQHKKTVEASAALSLAVADQDGLIGNPDEEDDERPKPPLPVFRTPEERREAALSKYRETATKYPGTGAATLARLSEGSLLLDKQDADGAMAAFNDVVDSPLAMADVEVKGRALEGLGFAYELKAVLKPEDKDKDLDAAIQKYREMEATDALGFTQVARYHQARCYETKGDKAKAIEFLKKLYEDLSKPNAVDDGHLFDALKESTEDRLRRLDPTALPAKRPHIGAGGDLPPELINQLPPELREKLRRSQQHQGAPE